MQNESMAVEIRTVVSFGEVFARLVVSDHQPTLKKKKKKIPGFTAFANFHGIDLPTRVDFKLPMCCH